MFTGEMSINFAERYEDGYQMGRICYGNRDFDIWLFGWLGRSLGFEVTIRVCRGYMDDDTQVQTGCDGETVVRVASRCAEGNEKMRRRCLDSMIQINCIWAFQVSNIGAFKPGVNFIL